MKCVDDHLKHLLSLVDNMNECARCLIKEIELKFSRSYIYCDIKLICDYKINIMKLRRNRI